ncbi:MAG TPA: hypothetical protein VHN15_12830 [Thermoanaerobaculia bacterium]|nr:hypothetical protein [Thermoanaerobaculia bacterium]
MLRSVARVWPLLLGVSLTASPAAAELFYVTLNNGSVLESRYQPQQSSWDPEMVLLMTDVGNWVGVGRDEIESVRSESENRGYGLVIDTTTILLGWAPNDAADPNAEPADGQAAGSAASNRTAAALESMARQRAAEESYSIPQFVEPGATRGIPSRFVGSTTSSIPPVQQQ